MVGGNVDFLLAGNILIGSVPGVILGSNMSVKWPQGVLRIVLGVVLIAAGVTILSKANGEIVPYAIGVAALAFAALFALQWALRKEVEGDPDEQAELERLRREEKRPDDAAAPVSRPEREPALTGAKD